MSVKPTRIYRPRELESGESVDGTYDGDDVDWGSSPVGSPPSSSGDSWKQPVVAATTADIDPAATGAGDTVDGVTLAAGDRWLAKDCTSVPVNGIYVAGATSSTRAPDMDDESEVLGAVVYVIGGSTNASSSWSVTSLTFEVLDADDIVWEAFGGGGGGGSHALDDLTDVDAPAPADGEVLTWDDGDGEWVARSALDTALVIVAAAGSTETIDVSVARTYQITLNDDCTFTLSGAVSTESWWVTIQVHQDSPGGYEITWPGSVNWPGDVTPTPPTDPPSVSVYTLWTFDGGTTWWGVLLASSGESFVADLDDLTDVTITTPSEGNALRYRSGVWVNEPLAATGGSLVTVDPGTPSYSVVGSNVEIAHDSVWGFDGTDPYYDSAGVVAGEEAALVYDYSDDTYSIIPYTPA